MKTTLIGLFALSLAACSDPVIPEGAFACGTTDPKCPPGFMCGPGNLCYQHTPDLAMLFDAGTGSVFGNGALGDPSASLAGKTGQLVLDTETGEIDLVPTGGGAATMVVLPEQNGFAHQAQSSGPDVAIWNFTSLTVPAGITIAPTPQDAHVPVFEATGDLVILGDINWIAYGSRGSASGSNKAGDGPNENTTGGGAANDAVGSGGGGAGYALAGSPGAGPGGGTSGPQFGTADLATVYFGAGGGGGAGGIGKGGNGGNGGGAFVLLAHMVEIGGTIDLSGGKGGNSASDMTTYGGGGGGAGGSLLIGGDSVLFDSDQDGGTGAQLRALGGVGGTGSSGNTGGAGSLGRISIASGTVVGTPASQNPQLSTQPALTAFPR